MLYNMVQALGQKERGRVMIIQLKPSEEIVILSCNTIISFLDSAARRGNSYWEDENGDGFNADIGYLYEGLEAIKEYCKEKKEETR